MTEHTKKHGFLGRIGRFFTRENRDPYAAFHFRESERTGDETWPAMEAPNTWSPVSAEILAEDAAYSSMPLRTQAVEENTVPSWLWCRVPQGNARSCETDVRQIFNRVTGAAAYKGWKLGLFANEGEACHFFNETRAMLMRRSIALEPHLLASLGIEWAYGTKAPKKPPSESSVPWVDIPNAMIDGMVQGVADKTVRSRWQKLWSSRGAASSVTLRLSNIAEDWGTSSLPGAGAMIDLMAFRNKEGSLDIEKLRHGVRLLVILCDLHGEVIGTRLDIGVCNLASSLMAWALPYDSKGAHAIAAAIHGVITAESYAASAELAGVRGPSEDYVKNRETVLRVLRNHRRAAYGDRNDYEKISVLPMPLVLEHCSDLALVAVAQRQWEDTLALVRQYGLRHTQVTSLRTSPKLAVFMESASQGIEPVASLTFQQEVEEGQYRQEIQPFVVEAIEKLDYEAAAGRAVIRHILGAGTLEKAPGVNLLALRARGFDGPALERVENYLRQVNNVRLAVTPWVVGEKFTRKVLKVSSAKIHNVRFDLLEHLGFSAAEIDAANAFCYGHGTARSAKGLRLTHVPVFAQSREISPEARILMAAAVQGFISGDTGLAFSLPTNAAVERGEFLLLSAWRQGVKSVTMTYDLAPVAKELKTAAAVHAQKSLKKPRKIRASDFLHTKSPTPMPARGTRSKARTSLLSAGNKEKSPASSRGKRG